ncbi:hypothetical protein GC197_01445 [bacterium]|nr:hypothetical protein [bacterium]
MMNPTRCPFGVAYVLFLATLVGCTQSNLPKTIPVKGRVSYQGAPVEDAMVIFSRGTSNMNNGEVAIGRTDAEGNFELTTHLSGQLDVGGVIPGNYKVTISKKIPPKGMTIETYQAKLDAFNKATEQGLPAPPGSQPPPLIEMFPTKYRSTASTELEAEVSESGDREFKFDLN